MARLTAGLMLMLLTMVLIKAPPLLVNILINYLHPQTSYAFVLLLSLLLNGAKFIYIYIIIFKYGTLIFLMRRYC